MPKPIQSSADIVPFSARPRSYARRPIASSAPAMTAIVLVRHGQTAKALLVSDTGDHAKAVWIPKAMVSIEMASDRGVLVASMSASFAQQKNLHPRFIDPARFNKATAEVLADAVARAARKRNFYRRHRAPTPYCMNRNVFA